MHADTGGEMLAAHRDMLIDGLRRIFGDFNDEMLQRVLPSVQWVEIGGGEVLYRQHERDESLYFVISGHLRATAESDGEQRILGDMVRGETVGEMAFFSGEPRMATVTAVRDSVLAHFSPEVFRQLLVAYPLIAINMTRLVIERLKRASQNRKIPAKSAVIAVAAISNRVDHRAFAARLAAALGRYGKTLVVDSIAVDGLLRDPGAAQLPVNNTDRSRRVARAMEGMETENRFVLVVADDDPSGWTERCLRQCDEMLLLADADEGEGLHPIETRFLATARGDSNEIGKTLVLLHPDDRAIPVNTRRWLDLRRPIRHVHLRRDFDPDWQRLGRIVSGNAVGLVLSGGGARGFAHLGIIKALEETGIGFDLVAGTSIGAAMAAYAAMGIPPAAAIAQARTAFRRSPTGDFNLVPMMSLFSGRRLRAAIDGAIVKSLGHHIDIEDLWKGYFCVSSNYSTARESVRTSGDLARSIRASVSIPGALPPVMLDGELHIDGSSFNNFPTDVMSEMGAAQIIGINLLRERNQKYALDEVPGPLALLRDKLRGRRNKLPSITSMLLNSSMIYSFARHKNAREYVDLYFEPTVYRYGMLEWSAFDRIVDAGYTYAKDELTKVDRALLAALRHETYQPHAPGNTAAAPLTESMLAAAVAAGGAALS